MSLSKKTHFAILAEQRDKESLGKLFSLQSLRLYEGASDHHFEAHLNYKNTFGSAQTRYVCVECRCRNLAKDMWEEIFVFIFKNEQGEVIGTNKKRVYVTPEQDYFRRCFRFWL